MVRTGFRLFRVDYSARDLLAMWKRQNQQAIERIVVYDPRSLATVWVVDEATGGYIALPYRVPRADMTLAESEAARRQLQALKAADRTEARLFGGPVATEPKMHFGASLLQEGLNSEDAAVPDAQSNPNGTEEVFHAGTPQGYPQ